MKIYVVTSGYYSAYSIERVFETREKAAAYCFVHQQNDRYREDYNIEEYDTADNDILLEEDKENGNELYISIIVHVRDKKFKVGDCCSVVNEYSSPEITSWYPHHDCDIHITAPISMPNDQILKIAQDRYAEWMAEKEVNK